MKEINIGPYQYIADDNWATGPDNFTWGETASVATDSQDNVYVYSRTDRPLMIFDSEGNYLRTWGKEIVNDAHGIYIDERDILYLVDREDQVALKVANNGEVLLEMGIRGQPSDTGYTSENKTVLRAAGPFHHPTDVAVSKSSGGFYISDGYRNARIHKFDSLGNLEFSWGNPGNGPGEFNLPHSVWEHKDKIYVADRQNHRLQIFDLKGQVVDIWNDFLQPCKIYIDSNDIIYVAELQSRISLVALDGTIIGRLGGPNQEGKEPGKFLSPHGIWVDTTGSIYVTEVLQGKRIQKLTRKSF